MKIGKISIAKCFQSQNVDSMWEVLIVDKLLGIKKFKALQGEIYIKINNI
jgi:hypothetical protein